MLDRRLENDACESPLELRGNFGGTEIPDQIALRVWLQVEIIVGGDELGLRPGLPEYPTHGLRLRDEQARLTQAILFPPIPQYTVIEPGQVGNAEVIPAKSTPRFVVGQAALWGDRVKWVDPSPGQKPVPPCLPQRNESRQRPPS